MSLLSIICGNPSNIDKNNYNLASIDIGWRNFVIYTRQIRDGKLHHSHVLYEDMGCIGNYERLHQTLEKWIPDKLHTLDGILIEEQLERNPHANRMAYYLIGYFSAQKFSKPHFLMTFLVSRLKTLAINPYFFAYKNMKSKTTVVDNTLMCGGLCISRDADHVKYYEQLVSSRGKSKVPHDVKADTIPRAYQLCEDLGDVRALKKLDDSRKKDDIADAVCQLDSFMLYIQLKWISP